MSELGLIYFSTAIPGPVVIIQGWVRKVSMVLLSPGLSPLKSWKPPLKFIHVMPRYMPDLLTKVIFVGSL